MKTIRYVDEIGVNKILSLMTEQDSAITGVLKNLSEIVVSMQEQIDALNTALKSTQDKLKEINFDMGQYDENNV